MKFLKYLQKNKSKKFKNFYLSYDSLLSSINPNFTDADEQLFLKSFESEFNRVFDFVLKQSNSYVEALNAIDPVSSPKALASIKKDIFTFAEFIRINVIGFKKLLKTHDKLTGFNLLSLYRKRFKEKINKIENLDNLLLQSSRLTLKSSKLKKTKESSSIFIRDCKKFWVHKENLMALKLNIAKYLPIFNYADPSLELDDFKDTPINSIYLDSDRFESYRERLFKNQDAEAIRIRWYGELGKEVFVERKKHSEGWTGESSKKLRFCIKTKDLASFLKGKDVYSKVQSINTENVETLYKEIQHSIVRKKMKPYLRTYYRRTAFQMPNDSSIRISLDTDLSMIKAEELKDCLCCNVFNSLNLDEFPFNRTPPESVERFPYAVLEVKTQCTESQVPRWIYDLVGSAYLEYVHKFSKFLHGMSVLYNERVERIPYWVPQMSTEIRKDVFCRASHRKEIQDNCIIEIESESETTSEGRTPQFGGEKKIAIPVRVEPKVFFANERTFLKWVQFAIFLGGLGTAMLSLTDKYGALSGMLLIIVSIVFAGYALYLYSWRAGRIRERDPGPYDDLVGPYVLVAMFVVAILLSMYFKFPLFRKFN